MSDLEKLQLQEKITDLEQDFKELEELRQKESEKLQIIKSKLEFLKDLAWDRQSKKESSSMYKVLKEDNMKPDDEKSLTSQNNESKNKPTYTLLRKR
ncbi:hypothetical protein [Campylobacter helveticus]|uniref:hypothetical protein n=1 Tax=Campylobacter helveticus TaxID=28898 RepID=UPI001111FF78|nr:hypothetical protein [Campylobacter helveticus]TNB61014.1 hypothetical protein FDW43_09410 [Campylobacter helveticus]